KHGAGELNYSSDIDLIVLYEAGAGLLADGVEPAKFFVRMTKRLVGLLQETTGDGYAFRVDLRLRPDPRATQIAIACEAAAIYYENMGQNWERAAMIKARPCAGDIAMGEAFLKRLTPYVWRKYLDYAAIADIQSLKRQIDAVKGHGKVAVRGHNVKLGRGGIREIEFFVQTQQLIAGGRNPVLRGRRTVDMLAALAVAGWIATEAAADLASRYRFLRHVEHRIQMVADEQAHDLPRDPDAFERLARLSGFATAAEFETELRRTFEAVQDHYARLFEAAGALGGEQGSLVFTGGEDDPGTIETLTRMGFRQASEVSATIRGWHFGRYAATRSARAKEILTEIMPELLLALSLTGDADAAFLAFDQFLSRLSSGVQIFSMLKANPDLLDLIARILGVAPRLAEELSLRPKVLDVILDADAPGRLPSRAELDHVTAALATPELSFESCLDAARIVGREQMFRAGVAILSNPGNADAAGAAFSDIADVLIDRLLAATRRDLADRHGGFPGDAVAVVALGKLGGREMTAASDLDLMLIYGAGEAEMSDGARPLSVMQYYTRLTQRLIAALSSPTAEGVLYEVDMRLRPSGSKGPVATRIESFEAYHQGSAWTWEKLALTRARVVAGDPGFSARVALAVAGALRQPRDLDRTRLDVLDMRRRMWTEIGSGGLWDLKHERGGLVDIEFIAQFIAIAHAAAEPSLLEPNTGLALEAAHRLGLLGMGDIEILRNACRLYQRLTQVLRLCIGKSASSTFPRGLRHLLAAAAESPDHAAAEARVADSQSEVRRVFGRLIGDF
ncbi:MAG TPA: bifunctional [glutamine synthetase] adenylyltransferase/[glutamine synthetase]-adenylyl-L-tyrosine phosphorylase, partial [Aestuariivirgaceae bacterium]|nr:bifunctional [glutamine synthetase] adenylyltransferase/[glutamine synthetase]-adenylyl-L-tyrosine phosphorylase [Aestuariivirgaceae bacterium]